VALDGEWFTAKAWAPLVFLLNLLSGEAWQITAGFPALTDIVSALVTARLATKSTASTKEEFLSRCSLLSGPRPDPSLMELNTGALAQLRGMYRRHSAPERWLQGVAEHDVVSERAHSCFLARARIVSWDYYSIRMRYRIHHFCVRVCTNSRLGSSSCHLDAPMAPEVP